MTLLDLDLIAANNNSDSEGVRTDALPLSGLRESDPPKKIRTLRHIKIAYETENNRGEQKWQQ